MGQSKTTQCTICIYINETDVKKNHFLADESKRVYTPYTCFIDQLKAASNFFCIISTLKRGDNLGKISYHEEIFCNESILQEKKKEKEIYITKEGLKCRTHTPLCHQNSLWPGLVSHTDKPFPNQDSL